MIEKEHDKFVLANALLYAAYVVANSGKEERDLALADMLEGVGGESMNYLTPQEIQDGCPVKVKLFTTKNGSGDKFVFCYDRNEGNFVEIEAE